MLRKQFIASFSLPDRIANILLSFSERLSVENIDNIINNIVIIKSYFEYINERFHVGMKVTNIYKQYYSEC